MRLATVTHLIKQGIRHACKHSDLTWRYIANLSPSLEHQRLCRPLPPPHQGLLENLRRDGIAIISMNEFMGDSPLYSELERAVWEYEDKMAEEIRRLRAKEVAPGRTKDYVVSLLGTFPTLNPSDIFVRFALQPSLVAIANSYFNMLTKLRYYNVWHNFAAHDPPKASQLWHRDPEDRAVLKMFVYLTDVDKNSGPLSYVPGTHLYGSIKKLAPSTFHKEGRVYVRRSNDDQMSRLVPESRWFTATVPKRTVVLADTTGYHKGGWVRQGERILYTCMFASRASTSPEIFRRSIPLPSYSDRSVAFAIAN